jgi:hypothetical protein
VRIRVHRLGLALLVAVGLCVAAGGVAAAQEQASPPGIGFSEKRTLQKNEPPKGTRWGDGKTSRGPAPIKEPAKSDEAYNWTYMAFSGGLMLVTALLVVALVRRSKRR